MNLRSKLGLEVEYWLENSWWSIKLSMKGEVGCTWNGGGLPVTSQVSLVFGNVRHSIVCLHDWLVICCGIYHTTLIYPSMNCHNIQYKKTTNPKNCHTIVIVCGSIWNGIHQNRELWESAACNLHTKGMGFYMFKDIFVPHGWADF